MFSQEKTMTVRKDVSGYPGIVQFSFSGISRYVDYYLIHSRERMTYE